MDALHSGGLAAAAGTDLQRAPRAVAADVFWHSLGSVLTTHLTEINQSQRADPSGWLFRGTFTDTKRKNHRKSFMKLCLLHQSASFFHALHHQRGFYTQQQVLVGEHGKGKGWLGWLKMYFYSPRTCRRCKVAAAGVLHTIGRFFFQALSAVFCFYSRSINRFCLILTSLWWVANVQNKPPNNVLMYWWWQNRVAVYF